jgi:hypothetical protein
MAGESQLPYRQVNMSLVCSMSNRVLGVVALWLKNR